MASAAPGTLGSQVPPGPNDIYERIAELRQQAQQALAFAANAQAVSSQLAANVAALAASGTTWAGPVASPSTVTAGGAISGASVAATGTVSGSQGTFSAGLNSVGAYSTDVSLLSGARQAVWQHNSGVYGFAPSTRASKENLRPVTFTAADVRAVMPYLFQYKGQLAIRDDPTNAEYDPNYVVPWDIGLMAEDLIAHGMGCFVFWEPDGVTPKGINYDIFAAVTTLVLDADVNARLTAAGL